MIKYSYSELKMNQRINKHKNGNEKQKKIINCKAPERLILEHEAYS